MLIVVLLVFIIIFTVGYKYTNDPENSWAVILSSVGIILCIVLIFVIATVFSNIISIDDRIVLYESQNQQIQQEISAIVDNYKDHESEVFIREASPITLVEAYPELKSNELVVKQIDLYVQNNEKLLELKEEKINLKVYGWWLFFNIGVSYE